MELRQRTQKRSSRASHKVDFRANTVGISKLEPDNVESFVVTLCCLQCGNVHQQQLKNENDEQNNQRDSILISKSCQNCSHAMKLEIIECFIHKRDGISFQWETLLNVDCKGCRIDLIHCKNWLITAQSGKKIQWKAESDFFDFDETSNSPLGVTDLDFYIRPI